MSIQRIFLTLLLLSTLLLGDSRENMAKASDAMVILLPTLAISKSVYERDAQGGWQYGATMLTSVAVTQILKYSIDAERPNGEDDLSFPSGHTSAAFATAGYLQIRYGWQYGAPAYAAATFVAWARVYSQNHYSRDVIAGAAIGVVSSYIFTTAFEDDLQVTPLVDKGFYGLKISSRF